MRGVAHVGAPASSSRSCTRAQSPRDSGAVLSPRPCRLRRRLGGCGYRATRLAPLGIGHRTGSPRPGWRVAGLPLEELWLAMNRVGDGGARALAEALPRLPRLQKVDLRSNAIADDGARALSDALLEWLPSTSSTFRKTASPMPARWHSQRRCQELFGCKSSG